MWVNTGTRCAAAHCRRRCLSAVVSSFVKKPALLFPALNEVAQEDLITASDRFGKGTYFIERSETGNLPVYSDYKGGGNKVITEIRKIRGDAVQLRNDLQPLLPFIPLENWRVAMQSKKIIIKGDYVKQVKRVLSKVI
ncbi:mitochondrial 54S ribosomal protein mL49 KNAG_0I02850 [Huiozyma naganishii CBS 8797]|uniref:Large ribosomal subunit protein mL49 n=1 Tax=Huiozyma naganishii (strain ATCC MYA-139 / BCRC 22969 / CBS 8797 / KCTC 17520 / NBRC 10181 / NCYC 3082 / Yp74L-3) TaxID=1071383 RepID=J7S9F1_HUIN7|nr:hypothetical protein KNAG_0I02850 [Kazachstania naganishii CBS 8797]CCK72069.1 hypothetical protein KNAG_0I02850 [Kazachstania naganishii CBS 8797]